MQNKMSAMFIVAIFIVIGCLFAVYCASTVTKSTFPLIKTPTDPYISHDEPAIRVTRITTQGDDLRMVEYYSVEKPQILCIWTDNLRTGAGDSHCVDVNRLITPQDLLNPSKISPLK